MEKDGMKKHIFINNLYLKENFKWKKKLIKSNILNLKFILITFIENNYLFYLFSKTI